MNPPRASLLFAVLAAGLALVPRAWAQRRPHIGYVYPAGGQQATTFAVKLGGQDLDDVSGVMVSGAGVEARVSEYFRRLNNQEVQLLNEQLRVLKRPAGAKSAAPAALIERIERRTREWVQTPACASMASLVLAEVTVAPEAAPGRRELRLITARGVSNPLVFEIGQLPEYARPAMRTATIQILGKEAQALRKRPAAETEVRVALPCTVNGQIASGEVNRYRFEAVKGQRLVFAVHGRELIPFIADAVPGWFQPVLSLHDAQGRELAFADDYRFKPDPVILYEVPRDGEYVIAIRDGIYRGREDFIYRITMGELPFVTSLFPLGGQAGVALPPDAGGWNLAAGDLAALPDPGLPGTCELVARRMGYASNPVPFVLDVLPDAAEHEPNNTPATAGQVTLPVVINGRIDRPDDWDVYQFAGRAGERVVVEVQARKLESPLDAVVKLTDAAGRLVAFNDDREDLTAGLNTHPADSYLMARLPADGNYLVHIGDTARQGSAAHGYRLRLSAPSPDFELRVVPSSVSLPVNGSAAVSVYAARRDGFAGPIRLALDQPLGGLTAAPVTLAGNQSVARFVLRGSAKPSDGPVRIAIAGTAKIGERELKHTAVPAEDRMQAFLWRHLVPASDLPVLVYDPKYQPPPKHPVPARPAAVAAVPVAASPGATAPAAGPAKPKFSKQQIAGRLRQLKLLYEEGLLTDEFYASKVAECDVAQ